MAASSTLSANAYTGFSNARAYDQHRPSYPPAAVSLLLENLKLASVPGATIIDLASGTGKFTEVLAAREEKYEILAVEPHAGMREELVRKALPGVKVVDGTAASTGVEGEWGDGVIAAQAWHWFADEKSLEEISRVLRPGGTFGMIWNVENYNAPMSWPAERKWEQVLKDILAELQDGTPRFRDLKWKDVFEEQLDTTPLQTLRDTFSGNLPKFSLPLGEDSVKWTVWLTDDAVWARYSTLSHIANLEESKKEQTKERVLEALREPSTERNEKGEIAVSGVTYMAWTSRI